MPCVRRRFARKNIIDLRIGFMVHNIRFLLFTVGIKTNNNNNGRVIVIWRVRCPEVASQNSSVYIRVLHVLPVDKSIQCFVPSVGTRTYIISVYAHIDNTHHIHSELVAPAFQQ